MFRPFLTTCLAAALALSPALPVLAAPFKLKGEPKVAMVIFGQKNDGGWSQAADEARVKMEAGLGMKIPAVDGVKENATAIRPVVELFIKRGHNIIIGTAFGYSDTFKELSEKYPDVAFFNLSGTTNGPNLESVYGRTYESQYLCGMAAGAASKTGKLGFVAANPFGVVNWTISAYELGARKMNPNATLNVVYTGAWNDPVKERAAAQALAEQGVDVLGQHVDTPATQIIAQERGILGTGHHRDMREFAPKATICSSVWTWDKFFVPEIKKVIAGTWEPAPYGAFITIADGGTDIACCGTAVPKAAAEAIMAERAAIIAGKHVFAGPLEDREGKLRVPAGQTLSDADLWKMDWYVKGVTTQK